MASAELEIEAIVLRRVELRDADLIVTLFSRDRGRFSAVARHARKSRRRFAGALEPGNVSAVRFRPKPLGGLETLTQAVLVEAHVGILARLDRIEWMGRAARLLDKLTPERVPEPVVYDRGRALLARLGAGRASEADVLAFHLGLLERLGHAPTLDRCVRCGEPAPAHRPAFFDPASGGVVSRRCGGGGILLSAEAREAMARATSSGVPGGEWSAALCAEVGRAVEAFTRHQLG